MIASLVMPHRAKVSTNSVITSALIGSAPQPSTRTRERSQVESSFSDARLPASANAKFGPKDKVAL